jgi:glycosyltransferase involved in cell wall biosynthesis
MGKVLLVSGPNPNIWRGGIETYLLNLYDLLVDLGHTVELEYFEKYGLSTYNLEDFYTYGLILSKKIESYDLLISNSIYGCFIPWSERSFVICHGLYKSMAENCIGSIGRISYMDFYYKHGLMENLAYDGRKVISVSSPLTVDLIKRHRPARVFTIRNCLDTELFSPRKIKRADNQLVGLFIGRRDVTKGYDIFSSLYRLTRGYVRWVQCLSTGGLGNLEVLTDVETYENIPNKEVPDLYNLVDFVFFPSRYEGFGMVPIEALACGKPVIAFQIGIFKTLSRFFPFLSLGHPTQGLEPTLLKALRIINMLKDEELRKHIGNVGRMLVVKYFDTKVWKRKWLRLLETMTLV